TARSFRVATSHRRSVPSAAPETSRRPSPVNATASTAPVCPVRAARSFPVAASHSRTSRSPPADARVLPSAAKARHTTGRPTPGPAVAREAGPPLPGGRVPQLQLRQPALAALVQDRAGRRHGPAVRADRHGGDDPGVAAQRRPLPARGEVPELHLAGQHLL